VHAPAGALYAAPAVAIGLAGERFDVLVREDIKVSRAPVAAAILQGLGFDARVAREHEVEVEPRRLTPA